MSFAAAIAMGVWEVGYVNAILDPIVGDKRYSSDKIVTLYFYVLLSVRLNINLVNDQLDAQIFYFIIRLLQSSTCFEQRHAHHQEVKLY